MCNLKHLHWIEDTNHYLRLSGRTDWPDGRSPPWWWSSLSPLEHSWDTSNLKQKLSHRDHCDLLTDLRPGPGPGWRWGKLELFSFLLVEKKVLLEWEAELRQLKLNSGVIMFVPTSESSFKSCVIQSLKETDKLSNKTSSNTNAMATSIQSVCKICNHILIYFYLICLFPKKLNSDSINDISNISMSL